MNDEFRPKPRRSSDCGTVLDRNGEQQIDDALPASDAFMQRLLTSSNDCIKVLDLDGKLMSMSEGGQRGLAIDDVAEFLGKSWPQMFVEEDRQTAADAVAQAAAGTPARFSGTVAKTTGEPRWWNSIVTPIPDDRGEPDRLLVISRDITDNKQAEDALRESEGNQRRLLEALPIAIYTTDENGRITYFNEAAVKLAGRTPEIGVDEWCVTWKLFTPDGDPLPHDQCPMAVALKENRPVTGAEIMAERPDGSRAAVIPFPVPLRDSSGELIGAVNTLVDITERKRAETQFKQQQEVFNELIERCPFGIYIVDSDFRIASMNQRSQDGAFANVRPVIGRPFDQAMRILWPEEVAQEIIGHFRHTLDTGEPFRSQDFVRSRSDIEQVEGYEWELHRIALPDRSFGVICYYYDSTELREVQRALSQSEARLRGKAARLRTLDHISRTIASETDLERMVQIVTDSATELTGAKFGSFFYNVSDEQGERYMLYTLSGAPREAFEKFGLPRNTPVFEQTFRGLGVVRSADIRKDPRYGKMAPHHGQPKGHLPVVSYLAVPVVAPSGEVLGGLFFGHDAVDVFTEESEEIVSDIAAHAAIALEKGRLLREAQSREEALRASEHRQRLLADELNHRVKNSLSIVQALALQTFSRPEVPIKVRSAFEGRLEALAGAHNVLTRAQWESADLADVARSAVAACNGASKQVEVKGPSLSVDPRTAVTISMALHELCTNAIKYGALSNEHGRVSLRWMVNGGEEPRLNLEWRESDGPPVHPPERRGFGSRMLERALAGELKAKVKLEFRAEGLLCTIDAPLPGHDRNKNDEIAQR